MNCHGYKSHLSVGVIKRPVELVDQVAAVINLCVVKTWSALLTTLCNVNRLTMSVALQVELSSW